MLLYTTPGASDFSFQIEDTFVGFVGQSSRFIKPVYRGESLYPELKISGLEPDETFGGVKLASTVHNERAEVVLEGEMTFLVQRRPPGA